MAKKCAFWRTIQVCAASDIFTQDVADPEEIQRARRRVEKPVAPVSAAAPAPATVRTACRRCPSAAARPTQPGRPPARSGDFIATLMTRSRGGQDGERHGFNPTALTMENASDDRGAVQDTRMPA
jgi:hypothetical protein